MPCQSTAFKTKKTIIINIIITVFEPLKLLVKCRNMLMKTKSKQGQLKAQLTRQEFRPLYLFYFVCEATEISDEQGFTKP
jgi:hypothetical protein